MGLTIRQLPSAIRRLSSADRHFPPGQIRYRPLRPALCGLCGTISRRTENPEPVIEIPATSRRTASSPPTDTTGPRDRSRSATSPKSLNLARPARPVDLSPGAVYATRDSSTPGAFERQRAFKERSLTRRGSAGMLTSKGHPGATCVDFGNEISSSLSVLAVGFQTPHSGEHHEYSYGQCPVVNRLFHV